MILARALGDAVGSSPMSTVTPIRPILLSRKTGDCNGGDGGLAMLMGDLLTVTRYDLPIKIVVFNNSVLGMVKLEMEVAGLPDYQTDLKNPNFAKLAEAVGIMGVRIENPADLSPGLKERFSILVPR